MKQKRFRRSRKQKPRKLDLVCGDGVNPMDDLIAFRKVIENVGFDPRWFGDPCSQKLVSRRHGMTHIMERHDQ